MQQYKPMKLLLLYSCHAKNMLWTAQICSDALMLRVLDIVLIGTTTAFFWIIFISHIEL